MEENDEDYTLLYIGTSGRTGRHGLTETDYESNDKYIILLTFKLFKLWKWKSFCSSGSGSSGG